MLDQNLVDRELCLEALRRGLVTREALIPLAQQKRANPARSMTGILVESGVLTPALGRELEGVARARAEALAASPQAASGAAPAVSPSEPDVIRRAPPSTQAAAGTTSGKQNPGTISGKQNPGTTSGKQNPGTTSGKQNIGTTSGKQNIGTISGKQNLAIPIPLPQSTIMDLDVGAPAPPKPALAPALKPPDPRTDPEAFRASRTYMDVEPPAGGRTMLADDGFQPAPEPAPEGGRTMLADDGFQPAPEPAAEAPRAPSAPATALPRSIQDDDRSAFPDNLSDDGARTMLVDDDLASGSGVENSAASGVPTAPAPGLPDDRTPRPADLKRAVAGTGRAAKPERRGPRDMEGPRIVVGAYFGDYEILSTLGEGAMGQVFRAKRRPDGLSVALKVMRGGLVANPKVRERFLREAKAAKRIEHPNVVRFIDAGMIGNDQYLAMEFVEGRSLQALLSEQRGKPLAFERASELVRQICSGLQAAHDAGVIHRDLKPENILLTKDGEVAKITDFGLARREEESMLLTRPGQVMGSPYYMAPEQGMGLPVDHRADIYSLGTIVFALFTGRVPFPFPSATEVIHAHCQAERPDPREVNPEIPSGLAAFILRLLAKDPVARPQSAKEALREFEEVHATEIERAPRPSPAGTLSDSDSSDDGFGPSGQHLVGALPPGTRVGPLTVQGILGAGGMGAVYRAAHASGRVSALKILPPQLATDPKRVKAFLREGELGSRVHHPNVVETREYGRDENLGVAYIEQELVEGTSLENLIKTGVMQDESLLVNIARGVAQALDGVHAAGVIHRDVKPANVLLAGEFLSRPDANVKLIDLGLAIERKDVEPSGKTQFAGTPVYMAPEQAATEGLVDERSDLYSLGATLYHAACAVPPFEGATPAAIAYQHQKTQPKPPRHHNAALSEAFEILIGILLAKNPDERFQTAAELVTELARTTPEGKLAKPQIHAKYRTNRLGKKGEVLRVESQAEPTAPPPRAAVITAALVVIACALALLVQLGRSILSKSTPAPDPSPVVAPSPVSTGPVVEPSPSPTLRPIDTLSEKEKHEWREKTIHEIEELLNKQQFLDARHLADKSVQQDGTIENRIQRVRRELEGAERVFDDDLLEARRLAVTKDWKTAQDKLDEATLFISRDDDSDRLARLKNDIADMRKSPRR